MKFGRQNNMSTVKVVGHIACWCVQLSYDDNFTWRPNWNEL